MVGSYKGNGSTLRNSFVVCVGKDSTPICLGVCSQGESNDNMVENHRVVLHRAPPFFLSGPLKTCVSIAHMD